MHQQPIKNKAIQEADIILALQEIKENTSLLLRAASLIFNVPRSTLYDRVAGKLFRRDCRPNLKKLNPTEESAIIKHILDLDKRGFPPTKAIIRDIANSLIVERGRQPIGKN